MNRGTLAFLAAAAVAGCSAESTPDKLGWLDDAALSTADMVRISQIAKGGAETNEGAIFGHNGLTRRDFELLRQDRRRAKAANPTVSDDALYGGTWVHVDRSAHVPDSWCTSGNSEGTEEDGKSYLDGGCYISVVRPEYPARADAAETKRKLAEIRAAENEKWFKHIAKWGLSFSEGGSNGRGLSVRCNPSPLPSDASDAAVPGKCVVVEDEVQYVFPFLPHEWTRDVISIGDIKKLASFADAETSAYVQPPAKTWAIEDGLLAKGEHCPAGRLCFSHWSGDGYDNTDIGPATPVCWHLDSWGLSYLPCETNGDRHSTPGSKWTLEVEWYGETAQDSPGWTEADCKAAMPQYLTGHTYPFGGQDEATANRGNLKVVKCFEDGSSKPLGIVLAEHGTPIRPAPPPEPPRCGSVIMPGQTCSFR